MYNPNFDEKTFRDSLTPYKLTIKEADTFLFRVRKLIPNETMMFPQGFYKVHKAVEKIAGEQSISNENAFLQIFEDPTPLFKAHNLPFVEEKAAYNVERAKAALSPYLLMQAKRTRNTDLTKRLSQRTIQDLAIPPVDRSGPRGLTRFKDEDLDDVPEKARGIRIRPARPPQEDIPELSARAVQPRRSAGTKGWSRGKIALPPNEHMADAVNEFYDREGSYPLPTSGEVVIDGTSYKWSTLMTRYRADHDKTLVAYAKIRRAELEEAKVKEAPAVVVSEPEIIVPDISALSAPEPEVVSEPVPALVPAAPIPEPEKTVPAPKAARKKPEPIKEAKTKPVLNGVDAVAVFMGVASFIKSKKNIPDPHQYHHYIGGKSAADIDKDLKKGKVSGLEKLVPKGTAIPHCLKDFVLSTGLGIKEGGNIVPASPKIIDQLVKAYG